LNRKSSAVYGAVIVLEHFIDNKRKRNYALVISDLRMAGMNDLQLLKHARKINPKVRTILISAYEVDTEPVFRGYVKDRVISKFIQKPIAMRKLSQEVSHHKSVHILQKEE
jgi:DNA-binding NtrC family response regulator